MALPADAFPDSTMLKLRSTALRWSLSLLAMLVLGTTQACGSSEKITNPPGGDTTAISLSVSGLPDSARAGWKLEAGDGAVIDSGSVLGQDTIWSIDPGTYTLLWENVTANAYGGPSTFAPDPASQSVTLQPQHDPVALSTAYRLSTGAVVASVSGLPEGGYVLWDLKGADGEWVFVKDGGGVRLEAGAVDTMTNVQPGEYKLYWSIDTPVTTPAGEETYSLPDDEWGTPLRITASPTPTEAHASYYLSTGDMDLTVTGIPSGTKVEWRMLDKVSGRLLAHGDAPAGTTHYTNIPASNYSLRSFTVSSGGTLYAPTTLEQAVTITAGETTAASLVYK
ncbi:MAG TPA: hypothetical protein VFK04_07440 [Gemmatimonadaceae bacterium]|nr:hypothetical protein [Gemmatimonadaceae bacterium]